MPSLSVVIPTHRRAAILRQCLAHLEKQTIADQLEVIVVSDGPDPQTANLFTDSKNYKLKTTNYYEIPKSQQGVARNEGVKHATAPITLFIGDDIFLAPGACEKHLNAHKRLAVSGERLALAASRYPLAAVLGFTTWDPALKITPVMYWLEATGWQFGYPLLRNFQHAFVPPSHQHRFTYTSHISLPTEIAKQIPFRTDVTMYGWEDIEWGGRLRDAGVALFYEPDAKACHHHYVTLDNSLRRMETLGRSLVAMQKIDPTFDRVPRGVKLLLYRLLSCVPTMRGTHYKAFLRGISEGKGK